MNEVERQILMNQLAILDVERLVYDKERRIAETLELLNPKDTSQEPCCDMDAIKLDGEKHE